ncbi:unnamed protein product [Blepharisma stoltei]|uniref:Uncharacterized protein n=1 Tax=Blepharisma stoltei TaxID=1481888 RepID=A0AAU9K7W2_9CILI|nr:unnamed protein product [Blepharisma stoltei]
MKKSQTASSSLSRRSPKFEDLKYNDKDINSFAFNFTKSPREPMDKQRIYTASNVKIPRLKLLNSGKIEKNDSDPSLFRVSGSRSTRDISHIKDKAKDESMSPCLPPILPTDISALAKLIDTTDPLGIPNSYSPRRINSPTNCQKGACSEILSKIPNKQSLKPEQSADLLERHYLGSPTGRQDVYNLKEWLKKMKEIYVKGISIENDQLTIEELTKAEVIYEMCEREIIRQVSVTCLERGELMQEVHAYFLKLHKLKLDTLVKEHNGKLEKIKGEMEVMGKKHTVTRAKAQEEIKSLNENIESLTNEKNILLGEISSLQERLNEMMEKASQEFLKLRTRRSSFMKPSNTMMPEARKLESSDIEASFSYNHEMVPDKINTKNEILLNEDHPNPPKISFLREKTNIYKFDEGTHILPIYRQLFKFEKKWEDQEIQVELDKENEKTFSEISTQTSNENNSESDSGKRFGDAAAQVKRKKGKSRRGTLVGKLKIPDLSPKPSINPSLLRTPDASPRPSINSLVPPKTPQPQNRSKSPATPLSERKGDRRKSFMVKPTSFLIPDEFPVLINEPASPAKAKPAIVIKQIDPNGKLIDEGIIQKQEELRKINSEISNKTNELEKLDHKLKIFESLIRKMGIQTQNPLLSEKQSPTLQTEKKTQKNPLLFVKPKKKRKRSGSEDIKIEVSDTDRLETQGSYNDLSIFSSKDSKKSKKMNQGDIVKLEEIIKNLPPDFDLEVWNSGYNCGFEMGKKEGFENGEELGIEEGILQGYVNALRETNDEGYTSANEEHWTDSSIESSATDMPSTLRDNLLDFQNFSVEMMESPFDKEIHDASFSDDEDKAQEKSYKPLNKREIIMKKRTKIVTKFMEFHFGRRNMVHIKKVNPASKLMADFLTNKIGWIIKRASMTSKMVNRIMATVYEGFANKIKTDEDGLLEATYDEFSQKYGLKTVCDRKFLEFIASLFKTADNLRSLVYLKFIGAGEKLYVRNYNKKSLEIYLDALAFMYNSKIGITINLDDTSDQIYLPTIRAVECIKEKMENFADKKMIAQIVSIVEKASIPDPKRINQGGLIESELVLKLIIDTYEEYQIRAQEGVIQALKSIKYDEDLSGISKAEFLILIRNISPQKYRNWHFDEEPAQDKLEDFLQLDKLVSLCIDKGLLLINDLKEYLPLPIDYSQEDILSEIDYTKEELYSIISQLKITNIEKPIKILSPDQWEIKLQNCEKSITQREPHLTKLAWKIFQDELIYIRNECFTP